MVLWTAVYALANTYTVYLKVPNTSACAYTPGVIGQFSGWSSSVRMTLQNSGDYAGYYMATVNADAGSTFKFRDADRNDWTNEIISTTGTGSEYQTGWFRMGDLRFPNDGNQVVLDYSTDAYQWLECYGVGTGSGNTSEFRTPAILQSQNDMPILFVHTANDQQVTSKDYYLNATYYLDARGQSWAKNIAADTLPDTLQIKGRGNWTWTGFNKKPYRLKLQNKTAMLGMKKNKNFGLLAHSDDWTGWMKNTMGFSLAKQLGLAWTPTHQPVELVMNGEYYGLYMLTELIRVEKDRVNVVEQPDECTNADSITGGWLIEIDNYGNQEPFHVQVNAPDDQFYVSAKTPEVWSSAQQQYLQQQMDALVAAIYGNDDEALEAILDIESAARFYLVQELMINGEAYTGSCYMHKNMNEDQWHFGPVWDFGNSFNAAYFGNNTDRFQPEFAEFTQHLIGHLLQHACMQQAVQRVWNHWRYYDYATSTDAVEEMSTRIAGAATRDPQVPAVQADARAMSWTNHTDAVAGKNSMLSYYHAHVAWLTQQWGVGQEDPTGLENANENANVKKVMINGHLYILQGKKLYNIMGF